MKLFEDPPPVVRAEDSTEQQLVIEAQSALSSCHFTVGRCASVWCELYSLDRNDAKFGDLIGMSGDMVRKCRGVWERFSETIPKLQELSWSHYSTALAWDDAIECLAWADENQASVAEMKAWRAAKNGLPFDEPVSETIPNPLKGLSETIPNLEDNPVIGSVTPRQKKRARVDESPNDPTPRKAEESQAKPESSKGTEPALPAAEPAPMPEQDTEKPILQRLVNLLAEIEDKASDTEKKAISTVLREWASVFKPSKPAPSKKFNPRSVTIPQSLLQGTFPQMWENWIEHREEIKKPMTETATKMALKKLESWGPARSAAALRHSMQNGYQGIFEENDKSAPGRNQDAFDEVFGNE